MKNLSELSDEQKSVMLARLCGWKYKKRGILGNSWWTEDDLIYDECYDQSEARLLDLYDTNNMALAWRVLNWAMENIPKFKGRLEETFLRIGILPYFQLDPNVAQRAWLDEILKLADETGMLEEQNENH